MVHKNRKWFVGLQGIQSNSKTVMLPLFAKVFKSPFLLIINYINIFVSKSISFGSITIGHEEQEFPIGPNKWTGVIDLLSLLVFHFV